MNTNDLLGFLTQLFFLMLGVVTTINYLRYGGETRRDIALMSGSCFCIALNECTSTRTSLIFE